MTVPSLLIKQRTKYKGFITGSSGCGKPRGEWLPKPLSTTARNRSSKLSHFLSLSLCIVIVCPLGAVWAYYIKVPYLLVRHRKRLCTRLNKVTLCFSFGGSRQSLKVREVKCVPGDPAITCPVLFRGSRSPLSLA